MSEKIRRYALVHRPGQMQPDFVLCKKSDYLAMCYSRDVSLIEAENAKLAAINAELLEALRGLAAVAGLAPIKGNLEALQEAYDIARAAIDKAKGEEV